MRRRRVSVSGAWYKVLKLPGIDVSTYLDGLKARAGRAQARPRAIGVPVP